jgi:polyphosphate kinase
MVRNLDRRIEVTCPIYETSLKREIDDVLAIQFSDNVKARVLMPDGKYIVDKANKKRDIRSQYAIHEYYKKKSKQE